MVSASREPEEEAEKDTPAPSIFKAVEALTKGIEVPLPGGLTFTDEEGRTRHRIRVRWWDGGAASFARAAIAFDDEVRRQLPDVPTPVNTRLGYSAEKPVFVGHYWWKGTHEPLAPNAACVDYSIAKKGRLCAYRYDGEPELLAEKFVSVGLGET